MICDHISYDQFTIYYYVIFFTGLFTSISKYHDAQKWDMPCLESDLHCRPFDAALEDALAQRESEQKQQNNKLSNSSNSNSSSSNKTVTNDKVNDNKSNGVKKEDEKDTNNKPVTNKTNKDNLSSTTTNNNTTTKKSNKNETTTSRKSADKKQQQQQNIKTEQQTTTNNRTTVSPPRPINASSVGVVSSSEEERNNSKVNPLHPRFHLLGGPASSTPHHSQQYPSYSSASTPLSSDHHTVSLQNISPLSDTNNKSKVSRLPNSSSEKIDRLSRISPPSSSVVVNGGGVVGVATGAPILSSPPNILVAGVERRRHSNTPPVLVCSVPSKLPVSSSKDTAIHHQHHLNNNNNVTSGAPSSSWTGVEKHNTSSSTTQPSSIPTSSSYPAEISNKKDLGHHYRSTNHNNNNSSTTKDFPHLSPKEFGIHHKLLEKPLVSATPVSSYKEREPPVALLGPVELQNGRTSLELAAEKVRMEASVARLKGSPPVLPRDHHHSSAFISPRDRSRNGGSESSFNGFGGSGGGGITPNGNALYNPLLRSHVSASSPFPPPTGSLHYKHQHPRDLLLERESMVDFSRNSVIIPPPPVRPSVTRSTSNGDVPSKTYEDYVPLTSPAIHLLKDRPASLPVSAAPDPYSPKGGVGIEKCSKEKNNLKKHHSPPLHSSAFSVDSLTAKSSRAEKLPLPSSAITSSRCKEQQQRDEEATQHARLLERHYSIPPSSHHPHHHRVLPPTPDSRIAPPFPPPHPHSLHHERLHIPPPHNGSSSGGIHNGLKRTLDEQLSTNLLHAEHRKYIEQMDWLRNKERMVSSSKSFLEFERLAAATSSVLPPGHHRTHPSGGGYPPASASASDLRSLYLSGGHFPPAHHRIHSNGHHRDLPSPPHHRLYSPYGRR